MSQFLDEAKIYVEAGSGGEGSMHFHREKYVSMGGPDGGDGGHGGKIVLRADQTLNTLYPFHRKRRFVAESGQQGGASKMHGRMGRDLTIALPIGTVVRDADSGVLLADLTEDGLEVVVAKGGRGGLGNVHFKTSTNQAPKFAEKGEPGGHRWLELELKIIAQVGIVGLPNAGKSTLLSVISAAKPKIADYPFTTVTPNLGVVDLGDSTLVAADIPGLIEGAHEGVGLGHEFLRHIERTLVLIHVVAGDEVDPASAFALVNHELEAHDADLTKKPQVVALSKVDLPDARDRLPSMKQEFTRLGFDVFPISAVTHEGLDRLLERVSTVLREQNRVREAEQPQTVDVFVPTPHPDRFEIERKRHTFHVRGETAERLAVMTDMESEEAVYRLQTRLKRMGVLAALKGAGAHDGSKVRIGEVEFTWDATYE